MSGPVQVTTLPTTIHTPSAPPLGQQVPPPSYGESTSAHHNNSLVPLTDHGRPVRWLTRARSRFQTDGASCTNIAAGVCYVGGPVILFLAFVGVGIAAVVTDGFGHFGH